MTTPSNPGPIENLASFMIGQAKSAGLNENQILQLMGFRNGVGPLEALLSGRPASETIPEIARGVMTGTDEVLKLTKAQMESAMPVVVQDELKPITRKVAMLNEEGRKHLDVYLNFLMTQGFIKK